MADALQEYLMKQGLQIVETSLKEAVGKSPDFVTNEANYRQKVIRKGWETLPVAIRMMIGKQYQRWDTLYLALINHVYDLGRGKVSLRPGTSAKVAELMQRFFGDRKSTRLNPVT